MIDGIARIWTVLLKGGVERSDRSLSVLIRAAPSHDPGIERLKIHARWSLSSIFGDFPWRSASRFARITSPQGNT